MLGDVFTVLYWLAVVGVCWLLLTTIYWVGVMIWATICELLYQVDRFFHSIRGK